VPLPCGCCLAAPRFRLSLLDLVGLVTLSMVRRRWLLQDRGGVSSWEVRLVERDGAFEVVVFGVRGNPCRIASIDMVTCASTAIPS
jgi:hypothetical protein